MWSLMDKIKFKSVCILMDFNHMRVWRGKNRFFFFFFSSLCLIASGLTKVVPGTEIPFSVLVLLLKKAFAKTRDVHNHH